MRRVSNAGLFFFVAATLFAQSNPVPLVNSPNPSLLPLRLNNATMRIPVKDSRQLGTFPPSGAGLNFETAVAYASGGQYAGSLAAADVNGDGRLDLLVVNEYCGSGCTNGTVAVLLGNGDGTFQAAVSYASGGFAALSVVVGDVNGDGKSDLLVANECVSGSNCDSENPDGTIAVLLGNGDGTFQAAVAYDSGGVAANSLVIGDVNGDGKPDVMVVNSCGFNSTECGTSYAANGTIGVLLGNGDGTFQAAVTYGSGGQLPSSIALEDVNNDGKPDLITANGCANSNNTGCGFSVAPGIVGVLLGNGDGTFQTAIPYTSGGDEALSVAVGDVNDDGKLDLVVANGCANDNCTGDSTIGVLLGNGDGTFQAAVTYDSNNASFVGISDTDGDGKPDLVVNGCGGNCSSGGAASVMLGNGDGTFQAALTFGSGGFGARTIVAGDVNGDGKLDLLVANQCVNNSCTDGTGAVGVLINISTKATITALLSSLNPSNFGQTVTFTATVTPQGTGAPTGTVAFFDGATSLGSSSMNGGGVAVLSNSALAIGTHSITAVYSGDANFAASTSPVLNQLVQGAIVILSSTSLNFGNQTVGISSTLQAVTLTNKGNVALSITGISVAGSDGGFAETNNCGTSVAAGGSCAVNLSWTPAKTGSMTGKITFTDSGPKSPQTVALAGVGVLPAVSLSSSSLTFSTQVVFTNSVAQSVTLNNTGLGTLSIAKVSVTGPFTQSNTCGISVAAGGKCAFTIAFMPMTIGMLTGSVSISDNAPASPQKIVLTGVGTYVQLSTGSLNFGNQPVSTKSLAKKVTLSNKGSVGVSITGISITGVDANDFAQTNTCGKIVAAGASCFISVTFTPSAKGNRTATVSITDNGGGSPQSVSLAGKGT